MAAELDINVLRHFSDRMAAKYEAAQQYAYCPSSEAYRRLMKEARDAKRGLDACYDAAGVKVPQVRLIGTACNSDPCEREQQCRSAGTCDSWRGRFPKDGEWPCEECGKPEKEHVGAGQQCPSGVKRFFPADPDGVTASTTQTKGVPDADGK